MSVSRLSLYNDALMALKQNALSSLTENTKARRLLDQVWTGGGVEYCLEQGQWQFATRFVEQDADPDIDMQFGYAYAFDKPDDWVVTCGVCSDDRFTTPLRDYKDTTDYLLADINPLYWMYVSKDAQFGLNLARWPQTFSDYVSMYFAGRICMGLTGDKALDDSINDQDKGKAQRTLLIAKNRAMMTQPARRPVLGNWVRSRVGFRNRGPMGDGGNTGSLIG